MDGRKTVAMGLREDDWFIMKIVFAKGAGAMVASEKKLLLSESALPKAHQTSVPYIPQLSGGVELDNKYITAAARTMFVDDANTVVYVLNRTGTSSVDWVL